MVNLENKQKITDYNFLFLETVIFKLFLKNIIFTYKILREIFRGFVFRLNFSWFLYKQYIAIFKSYF
ncbi:hypothetical protein DKE42_008935 [Acinetobacter pittii]|nr:hypothetical protein DKE42_008935 [Acinetobacter pittii]